MLLFPLLRDFHFESAFVASIVGCFWGAVTAIKRTSSGDFSPTVKIVCYTLLIGLPPFLFSLFAGCLTFDGFGFWVLLPVPSVFFGTGIARLVRELSFPKPLIFSITLLLILSVVGWLVEFFTLPQVYFFNHVWGTWPGPIYDETLKVTDSLLFFRWITTLWIVLLWVLPNWNSSIQNKMITFLALASLLFCYLNLDEMGVITSRETLKERLAIHQKTQHFDLYFDESSFNEEETEYWSAKHEFHFQQIVEELNIDWPKNRKIESFIYANAWQKKKLVGAKFTSYVPIWLEQDQLHIAKQQLDGVLKHELVHAISKQFGNNLFNGSWSIGMIEGVAEAIAADASRESTLDQIIAAEDSYPTPDQMKTALSNAGFYSSASSISYTTAGSFVRYLLNNYPVDNFKRAYPNNNFESAYPVSFDTLVEEWHKQLDSVKVDSIDQQISEFIFSRRSLFQKKCPHAVSKEAALWDKYNFHMANRDSAGALQTINELFETNPDNQLVKRDWIQQQLQNKKYATALYAFNETDSLLTLELLHADALFLSGDYSSAQKFMEALTPKLALSNARNFKYSHSLRSDSLNWSAFLQSRYNNIHPEPELFALLNYPVQLVTTSKAAEFHHSKFLPDYSATLKKHSLHSDWFDIYEQFVDQLIFHDYLNIADKWLAQLSELTLRQRHKERLEELYKWKIFIAQTN